MNITELIPQLEALREKHGDLPVYGYHQTFGLARIYPLERLSTDIGKEYIALNLHPLPWKNPD